MDVVRQMRVSAIHEGEALYGRRVIEDWRSSGGYPYQLVVATISSFLTRSRLSSWRLWRVLVQRNDVVMLQSAMSEMAQVLLGTLSGLNRIYIEHPSFKWARCLLPRFERAPVDFYERFFGALSTSPIEGASQLHSLLIETVELVSDDLPEVDVAGLQDLLIGRR